MRFIIAIFSLLAVLGCTSPGATNGFVEDNDLWMEDSLDAKGGLTQDQFNGVIAAAKSVYDPIAQSSGDMLLQINANWDDATVNASCTRMFGFVMINMYGGLARREEVTTEGFALVLCHELSHAYGGTPYIQEANKLSAEGQADYEGTRTCLSKVLPKLASSLGDIDPYWTEKCGTDELCLRKLAAGQSLGTLLATIKNEPIPDYQTPDPKVVDATMLSYPDTIQCRLDTYFNGSLNKERPKCWFKN